MAVAVVAAAVTLAGCSPSNERDKATPVSAPSPSFSGSVPEFTGPWAAEFAEAYRSTTSEVVHEILAKGSITDQDYAAVSSAYVTCMANKGFTAKITGNAGEGSVDGPGDVQAGDNSCNADMAVISALRYEVSRNPQRLDENEIVVACLVTKKVAPPSYTAKDYARDLETQEFPFGTGSSTFMRCTSDPLGLSSGQ